MGRKIPGRKHRTIKDPAKQQEARLDSIRHKINNPPRNANDQEIPKSLVELMKLKAKAQRESNRVTTRKRKKKRDKSNLLSVFRVLDKYPKGESNRYIPNLVQKPNESPNCFLRRMNSMTQKLIDEIEFEENFGVEVKKNQDTGEIIEVKKIKNKKTSKKKKLSDKRKEKKLKKKENSTNIKDFNQLKDNIPFGEVVQRPPNLTIFNKTAKEIQTKSKFSNLLLHKVAESTVVKKSEKSALERERAENARKFVVEAYRKAKQKRQTNQNDQRD